MEKRELAEINLTERQRLDHVLQEAFSRMMITLPCPRGIRWNGENLVIFDRRHYQQR